MIFDPVAEGKKATYFKMIECIVPRPIAWVSTQDKNGVKNLAPFSFFTGVTSAPATLLFCCGNKRGGVPKDTVANIMETGQFVVNIVPYSLCQKMVQTSAPYAAHIDEFQATGLAFSPSERVDPPRVSGAPIAFECSHYSIQEIQDEAGRVTSRVVIGRIELIHVDDSVMDSEGQINVARLDVVARLGGQAYAQIGEPFELSRPVV